MTTIICRPCGGTGDGEFVEGEGTVQCRSCNGSGRVDIDLTRGQTQHSASRAAELLLAAGQVAHAIGQAPDYALDAHNLAGMLTDVAEIVGQLGADLDAFARSTTTDLRYIARLEVANSTHLLTIADLKTRLSRAAEEMESLTKLTSHAVGDAAERHLIATRARALLDLTTPLPPRNGIIPTATSTNGALHNAATSH